jgi:RP/EB family microtubule-associated protein
MSESRSELIGWINDLLQIGATKVEQVGMGAIPCQVLDSIWGDVALHKVKFSACQEYEYLGNWKVFQSAMDAHGIVKDIPVEKLIKLRFQDNLVSTHPFFG